MRCKTVVCVSRLATPGKNYINEVANRKTDRLLHTRNPGYITDKKSYENPLKVSERQGQNNSIP